MVATTPTAPATTSQAPHRFANGGLITGGLLLVVMYVLQIVQGLLTGEVLSQQNAMSRPLFYFSGLTFCLGLVGIAIGLGGIGLAIQSRSPKLATAGLALPLLAALAPALNIMLMLGITGQHMVYGPINGLSVLANLGGAVLLGIAVLRTRALPRSIGWTLLVVGLITFPLILLTIPAEQLLPGYVAMDMPFPVWGAIFAGLSLMLMRETGAE